MILEKIVGNEENNRANRIIGLHEQNSKLTYQELLLVPRKLVKLRKISSGPVSTYVIEKRLDKYATKLDTPTEFSGLGLSSGLRSAIIRMNDGRYVKLKGVAFNSFMHQGAAYSPDRPWGVFNFIECVREICMSYGFSGYGLVDIKPLHVDIIPLPKLSYSKIIPETIEPKHIQLAHFEDIENRYKEMTKFTQEYAAISEYASRNTVPVPAYEIQGDTRLDEMIYLLTKYDLGDDARFRDHAMQYLCFASGAAKALMTDMGVCWGEDVRNTNAHIGNFVILLDKDQIDVKITDMGQARTITGLGGAEPFLKLAHEEVESFKGDLLEKTTISTPTRLPYRFFSDELRENCFQAIKSGYYNGLKRLGTTNIDHLKPQKDIHPEKYTAQDLGVILQLMKLYGEFPQ